MFLRTRVLTDVTWKKLPWLNAFGRSWAAQDRAAEPWMVNWWRAFKGEQKLCTHPPKAFGPIPLCGEHPGRVRCAETFGKCWSVFLYIYSGALYSVLIRETIVLKSFFKNFLVAQTTV